MRPQDTELPADISRLLVVPAQQEDRELTTAKDTERLSGEIAVVRERLSWVIGISAAILALLGSTYGVMAYFTWRLTVTLLESSN